MYRAENGQAEWLPPRDDINSPDLYIPGEFSFQYMNVDEGLTLRTVMALVTYVLLAALYSGLNSRFHPEVLGSAASKAIAVVILDMAFIYLGCYFLNIQVRFHTFAQVTTPYLDLFHPGAKPTP